MELEDNGIGDVVEGEDQLSWSFFLWGELYHLGIQFSHLRGNDQIDQIEMGMAKVEWV